MARHPDVISEAILLRALRDVASELVETGLLTDGLTRIPVVLQGIALGRAAGWFIERPGWLERLRGLSASTIQIPRTSLARVVARLTGRHYPTCSLRDVLRHEYGHAYAQAHPRRVRRNRHFSVVFGAPYDSRTPAANPSWNDHITPYATTAPYEDFAEIFMTYLRVRGRIGRFRHRSGVYAKLRFVKKLAGCQ
jgi:hypothetical protein